MNGSFCFSKDRLKAKCSPLKISQKRFFKARNGLYVRNRKNHSFLHLHKVINAILDKDIAYENEEKWVLKNLRKNQHASWVYIQT